MSKSEYKTIGIHTETYNRLRKRTIENCQIITSLASKFIDKGLDELDLKNNDKKKEKEM